MKYSFHTMVSLANIGYSQLSVIMSDGCFLMMRIPAQIVHEFIL
jgi:hypothetical protein